MRATEFIKEIRRGTFVHDEELGGLITARWAEYAEQNIPVEFSVGKYAVVKTKNKITGDELYFVLDGKTPIGELVKRNNAYGTKWPVVISASIIPAFRNKGIIKKVYKKLLDSAPLMSDIEQTKEAEMLWRSFYPEFNMYLYNSATGKTKQITDKKQINLAYPPNEKYTNLIISKGGV